MWSALFLTLPTQPNAVRLRVWRALKAMGCGALRDGVHVLPASQTVLFEPVVADVQSHGGHASVLDLSTTNEEQRTELLALFDRADAYAQWSRDAQSFGDDLSSLSEADARRHWRHLAETRLALGKIDYYPGEAAAQADETLEALRQSLESHFSPGEPAAQPTHSIERLDLRKFQRKRWVTRARPWVDRLASAWLIKRFIDNDARFVWLSDPDGAAPAPRGSVGFDYNGARFTHVGLRVSFEVLMASFGLDDDAPLQRIARIVRYLDVGGIAVPEAAGLEAVLAGLRAVHKKDEHLRLAAATVFDALYAAPGATA